MTQRLLSSKGETGSGMRRRGEGVQLTAGAEQSKEEQKPGTNLWPTLRIMLWLLFLMWLCCHEWPDLSVCPAGSFPAKGPHEVVCKPCHAAILDQAAQSICADVGAHSCPKGQHSTWNGCKPCGASTFKDWEGFGACRECPKNAFGATEGAHKCTACPNGSASWTEGSKHCECLAGWTRTARDGTLHSTSKPCFACPPNTFKDDTGSGSCASCPTGWTSPPGSTRLSDCTPNSFSDALLSVTLAIANGEVASAEAKWGRQMGERMAASVEESLNAVSTSLSETAGAVMTWTSEVPFATIQMMWNLCLDLFGTMEAFWHAAGWHEEGKSSSGGRDSSCAFRSAADAEAWIKNSAEWKAFRAAMRTVYRSAGTSTCKGARDASKRLLLVVHPDKFNARHPDCPPNLSLDVVKELNGDNDSVKGRCRQFTRGR